METQSYTATVESWRRCNCMCVSFARRSSQPCAEVGACVKLCWTTGSQVKLDRLKVCPCWLPQSFLIIMAPQTGLRRDLSLRAWDSELARFRPTNVVFKCTAGGGGRTLVVLVPSGSNCQHNEDLGFYLSIDLSIYLFIYLSIYLSICRNVCFVPITPALLWYPGIQ